MLNYIEDTHEITAGEAAIATAFVIAYGPNKTVYTGIPNWQPTREEKPWRLYSLSSHIVDASGVLVPGVHIVLFSQLSRSQLGFMRLAEGYQGMGRYVRYNSAEGMRTDCGVAVAVNWMSALWVTAGCFQITRAVYEVVK